MLHPVVKILGLIVLAGTMPLWPLSGLCLVLLGLLLLNRAAHPFASLWRARWLLLTIFILYAGFTAGEPVIPQFPGISREGFLEAARRCCVLATLIQAVALLMRTTSLMQLTQGFSLMLMPLSFLGLDHHCFARRLSLVLERVVTLQVRLAETRARYPDSWADVAAELINEIESGVFATEVRA